MSLGKRSSIDTEETPPLKFVKDDTEDLPQPANTQSASNDHEKIASSTEEPLDSTSEIIFKLSSILPKKIEARVLASQHDLCKQLKVTVEKRLEQWSFEETRFQELNLELPSFYDNKLQSDDNLLHQIFAPLFGKVKKSAKLTFPNMRIDILNRVISKLEFQGEYQIIEVPFSVENPSTIAEHCLEFITLVHNSSTQEILFQPSPQHSENYKDLKLKVVKHFGKDSAEPLIKYGKQKIFPIKKKQDSSATPSDVKKPKKRKSLTGDKPLKNDSHQKKRKSITASPSINPSYTFDQRLHGPYSEGLSPEIFTAYNYWEIDKFHAHSITGEGVIVAVVDSGIDSSHPAFANKCFDPVNFKDFTNSSNTNDNIGHGTMCAGIICGDPFKYSKNPNEYNDGEPLETFPPGIAPDATLVVYKVFADNSTNGSSSVMCQALEHIAARDDIDIVCLSLGSLKFSLPIAKAITSLVYKGVIVVCAASNHGNKFLQTIDFPARLGHVLSIGSHGPNGKATSFSPVGQQIDFLAPGENIFAPCSIPCHHYITKKSGTSYAAPAVVGLICLLLDYINRSEKYRHLIPHFKHHWVMKELLREMSTSPGRPTNDEGFGALNPMSFYWQPESFVEKILLYIDFHDD